MGKQPKQSIFYTNTSQMATLLNDVFSETASLAFWYEVVVTGDINFLTLKIWNPTPRL